MAAMSSRAAECGRREIKDLKTDTSTTRQVLLQPILFNLLDSYIGSGEAEEASREAKE